MKARVSYSLSRTVNTGNYENFKIGCEAVVEWLEEEMSEAFDKAKEFVRQRVEYEEADLLGKLDK